MTIINAIEYLSKEFGTTVVAEGVETLDQQAVLLEKGFRIGQGFLYQKPLSFNLFYDLLKEQNRTAVGSRSHSGLH